jgi:hypothetical protein
MPSTSPKNGFPVFKSFARVSAVSYASFIVVAITPVGPLFNHPAVYNPGT